MFNNQILRYIRTYHHVEATEDGAKEQETIEHAYIIEAEITKLNREEHKSKIPKPKQKQKIRKQSMYISNLLFSL